MRPQEQHDLEEALRAVPGVASADLQAEAHGADPADLGTLRLALEPGADGVAVAAAVGLLLEQEYGVGVDPSRIALESTPPAAPAPSPAPAAAPSPAPAPSPAEVPAQRGLRPSITEVRLVSAGLEVTATVVLEQQGRSSTGTSSSAASSRGVQRAVANATLRSVEALSGGALRLELEQVEVAELGSERTVLVALTLLTSRATERLTGAAVVRDDVRSAVIRATLDALNRRLGLGASA